MRKFVLCFSAIAMLAACGRDSGDPAPAETGEAPPDAADIETGPAPIVEVPASDNLPGLTAPASGIA